MELVEYELLYPSVTISDYRSNVSFCYNICRGVSKSGTCIPHLHKKT